MQDFMADKDQREVVFPAALAAQDRRAVHAACDAFGLLHQSRGDEPERQLVVWKPGANPAVHHPRRSEPVPYTPFSDGIHSGVLSDESSDGAILSPMAPILSPMAPSQINCSVVGALFSMTGLQRSVMACRADSQPLPEDIQAHDRSRLMDRVLEEVESRGR